MMLERHVPNSSNDLQRNPLATKKTSNVTNTIRWNSLSYQLGQLDEVVVPNLYPVVYNLRKIVLRGRGREGHCIILIKTYTPSNYRYPVYMRVQISKPIGRGRSTMEQLRETQYILHLLCPRGRHLHPRGLRPAWGEVAIGYHLVWSGGLGSRDRMYFDLLGRSSAWSEGGITWSAVRDEPF